MNKPVEYVEKSAVMESLEKMIQQVQAGGKEFNRETAELLRGTVRGILDLTPAIKIESEKTADQRLADLGYRKNASACYSEKAGVLLYEKPVMDSSDCLQIYFNGGEVLYWNLAGHALWAFPELVSAIDAKCKEMGWK